MINRREFIGGLAALGSSIFIIPVLKAAPLSGNAAPPLKPVGALSLQGPPSQAVFTALVGQMFYVYGGSRPKRKAYMQLAEVQSAYENAPAGTEQFSVFFIAPHSAHFPAGIYTFRHKTEGKIRLHIQPIGSNAFGRHYVANFNLLPFVGLTQSIDQ
jgi:hypothetical protein